MTKNNELAEAIKEKIKNMNAKDMAEFVKKLIAQRPDIAAEALKKFKEKK